MDFGIVGVASITAICYLVAQALKATSLDSKWLPVLCGCCGAILGVAALLIRVPDFPGDDPLTALGVGIASGLAATGAHQLGKQLNSGS